MILKNQTLAAQKLGIDCVKVSPFQASPLTMWLSTFMQIIFILINKKYI